MSRVFSSCVTFMYRKISWTWHAVLERQIILLLWSILEHAELASFIYRVRILSSPGRPYDKAWEHPPPDST